MSRPYAGIADHLAVSIGADLLDIVPGRVSTEVDANLSYDTQKTIDKVYSPLALLSEQGHLLCMIFYKLYQALVS